MLWFIVRIFMNLQVDSFSFIKHYLNIRDVLENYSSYSMKKVVFYIKYSIPFSELTNTRMM